MKRIITISLVLAAFVSCSKTDITYEPTGEIQIIPVNENVTKSVMSTNEFKGSEFMVWSWFNPAGAGTDVISTWQSGFTSNATSLYINEKKFVEKTVKNRENVWGGAIPYFWPKTGSLVFAGYHAPNLTAEGRVTYTFNSTDNFMTFNDVQQVKVAEPTISSEGTTQTWKEDIMYFNMTPNSYNTTSGTVNLKFNHALTWMAVTLSKKTNPEIEAKIKIHDVWFTDVCTTGDGKVDGQNTIDWTEDTATKAEHYVLKDGQVELEYDKSGSEIQSVIVYLDDYLIIPQAIYGSLKVKYSVTSSDDSTFTEVYTVDLKSLKEGSHNEWLPGKHYIYNISIGTDELLVTPEVNNWEDKNTSILIPMPEVTPGQPGTNE